MCNAKPFGKKIWAFAAGHIPGLTTGPEPDFTSHDKISVLNTSSYNANVGIEIFYENAASVIFRTIEVKARRLRKVRFNDLIDPLPVPLDTPFGFILTSDIEVIVQFSRMNTAQRALTSFCITPYYIV